MKEWMNEWKGKTRDLLLRRLQQLFHNNHSLHLQKLCYSYSPIKTINNDWRKPSIRPPRQEYFFSFPKKADFNTCFIFVQNISTFFAFFTH